MTISKCRRPNNDCTLEMKLRSPATQSRVRSENWSYFLSTSRRDSRGSGWDCGYFLLASWVALEHCRPTGGRTIQLNEVALQERFQISKLKFASSIDQASARLILRSMDKAALGDPRAVPIEGSDYHRRRSLSGSNWPSSGAQLTLRSMLTQPVDLRGSTSLPRPSAEPKRCRYRCQVGELHPNSPCPSLP